MIQLVRFPFCLFLALLFRHVLPASLPAYEGPNGVGIIDVEVPVSNPRNVTDTTLKSNGEAAFQLQTVLFSLYYPIASGASSSASQHYWVPRPISATAAGIAHAFGVPEALVSGALNVIAGNIRIPAQVDVNLLGGNEKFPIIMFSPGDGALPTWYSYINGELAARGSVLAGLQHRDGSSPTTIVMLPGGQNRTVSALTVDDVNPAMNNTEFQLRKLQMRQAELEEAIKVVQSINSGNGKAVAQNNTRGEGQTLSGWNDRLDLGNMIIAGHSLGSNLALQAVKGAPSTAVPANASLNFDPGKDSGPLNTDVTVPLAIIDSEEWSGTPTNFFGQQHFDVVKGIAQNALAKNNKSWFMSLLGTAHFSITDAPLITTSVLSLFSNYTSKNPLVPKTALTDYIDVADAFISAVVNGTRTGELAKKADYPEFKLLPNATVQADPFEIHVSAASGNGNGSSSGSGSGSGSGSSGGSETSSGGSTTSTGAASHVGSDGLMYWSVYVVLIALGMASWMG